MRVFIVRFDRSKIDDLEIAKISFPESNDPLSHQFIAELREAEQIIGLDNRKIFFGSMFKSESEDTYWIWSHIQSSSDMTFQEFKSILQSYYDLGGMAGQFQIIDVKPRLESDPTL